MNDSIEYLKDALVWVRDDNSGMGPWLVGQIAGKIEKAIQLIEADQAKLSELSTENISYRARLATAENALAELDRKWVTE